jgi:hypothetical protein
MSKKFSRFLSEFAIFFLLLIAGAYILDRFITENLKKYPVADSGIWNEIFAGRIDSEIVVYGASRALVHFDSNIMENYLGATVYNLGINGHNFWLQYLRHSILLKYNAKPKVIILEISTETLEKRKDLYDLDQFLPYMLNQPEVEAAISSYEGYDYLDFHIPLLRYYGKAESLVRASIQFLRPTHYKPDRVKGYIGNDADWNGGWERTKLSAVHSKVVFDQETAILLNSFLEENKARGIKVIFVSSPRFYHAQQYTKNRNEVMTYFEVLSKKYDIPFLDYSNDPISFESKFFYNSSHLNKRGAELFTRRFVVDLKSLL